MSLNGIDISGWQKGIDLSKVPCDFVIVKATQGVSFTSPTFKSQYASAKKLGKLLGVYHYAGGGGAVAEADYFVSVVKDCIGEAILVLDWEGNQNPNFASVSYAKSFLDRVYAKTGVKPLIYMSKSVCREHDWSKVVSSGYGLWMAQYANNKATGYKSNPWTDTKGIGAFKKALIYQYSSAGRLSGYPANLDLNIAYITKSQWASYAGASKPTSSTSRKPSKSASTSSSVAKASLVDLLVDTLSGKYGNGDARKNVLGGRYTEVQSVINHIATASVSTLVTETKAGKYGNGNDRKIILGSRYTEVQNKINSASSNTSSSYKVYEVRSGDTLSGIADKYDTTVAKLSSINGIKDVNKIYVGQKIRVK